MPRLTPADVADWRRQLSEEGDGEFLDPTVAQDIAPRLVAEVEALWSERDTTRLDALREAALLVDRRIADLTKRGPPGAEAHGCVHCHDAEARRLALALRERAEGRIGNQNVTLSGVRRAQ